MDEPFGPVDEGAPRPTPATCGEEDDASAPPLWPTMLRFGWRAATAGGLFTLLVVCTAPWSRETPRQSADYLTLAATMAAAPAVLLSPLALSAAHRPLVLLLGCACCAFVGGLLLTTWIVGLPVASSR